MIHNTRFACHDIELSDCDYMTKENENFSRGKMFCKTLHLNSIVLMLVAREFAILQVIS
jgi:hypothetical protein